jgi:hypothetical protein
MPVMAVAQTAMTSTRSGAHADWAAEEWQETSSLFLPRFVTLGDRAPGFPERSLSMSTIPLPLDVQRRFEQRWTARFGGSPDIPAVPKNVVKGSPAHIWPRAAKAKQKPAVLGRRV